MTITKQQDRGREKDRPTLEFVYIICIDIPLAKTFYHVAISSCKEGWKILSLFQVKVKKPELLVLREKKN